MLFLYLMVNKKCLFYPLYLGFFSQLNLYLILFVFDQLSIICLIAPYVFSIAWRMIKPLITGTTHEKIRFVYSNFEEEVHKFVDPDQLPISYGGTLPDDSEVRI